MTGLVHKFTHEFDAQRVVAEMQVAAFFRGSSTEAAASAPHRAGNKHGQARDSWEWKQQKYLKEDGAVMSGDEIAAAWRRNGLVQRSRGTLLHFTVEAFLNFDSIQGPYSPEFCQWLQVTSTLWGAGRTARSPEWGALWFTPPA